MARPKEFDRDEAVKRAVAVFWEKGYEATSTDELLRAMGIGRQSMYDTFGDKHSLFLEALQRYNADSQAAMVERLRAGTSPLSALRDVLLAIANEPPARRARGCMGVNAITECAQADPEVASLSKASGLMCEATLESVVREAKQKGEVATHVDERAAGRFLLNTLQGLRVSAKAGVSPEALRDIAQFAIESLRAR
ncbi:TetR/AcrR family transcriptional regulator [Hyalangium versicolor]|uniref:TetR/AcrR family transcriptional regulator n=1 Tax=Hyalangium versicolor TaxID=2861190 RepID=UPI001CCD5AFA|nr:TetR/AcrR family transcriptional regulator [Hyalangium versicolor]